MNNLCAMLNLLGLRDRSASEFLGIGAKSLSNMISGHRETPKGIISELTGIHTRLVETAAKVVDRMDAMTEMDNEVYRFTLGITTTDADARKLGWPSFLTHAIMGATVVATSHNMVTLVDRYIPPDVESYVPIIGDCADEEEITLLKK